MSDAPSREMRLDELAAAAGVATTTVRLYRQRGLLPPPRLQGRTGWYAAAHLARLRLIGRLQVEGFSLAGIATLLESWEHGRDLGDLVGVEEQLDELLGHQRSVVLEPQELVARFPVPLSAEEVRRAATMGVIELLDDGRIRIPDERFVDTGAALIGLGVPAAVVLDEWAALRRQTDAVAKRFVAVFEAHLLPDDWRSDLDAERTRELAATLGRLRQLAGQVLQAALDASVAEVGRKRLGELVPPAAEGS